MPSATQFFAKGKGNGFPFCLDNFSSLNTAFSNSSSGDLDSVVLDRTDAVSLDDLMFFFWNLSEFTTCTFNYDFTDPPDTNSESLTVSPGDIRMGNIESSGPLSIPTANELKLNEPRERVRFENVITDQGPLSLVDLVLVQALEQENGTATFVYGLFLMPCLNSSGNPCIAYALNGKADNGRIRIANPATAANAFNAINGSEVSVNLPLNSSGTTVAIKFVGEQLANGNTTTATSGNIVADFYTYS